MADTEAERMTVAGFITRCIELSDKSQRQIAAEAGFDNPNVLTMIKQGLTKVPLRRIGTLARALNIAPAHLMRLVMSEYMPDTWAAVEEVLGGTMLTKNERELVACYRQATNDANPPVEVIGGVLVALRPVMAG